MSVKTGDKIPQIILPDQSGKSINLQDYLGRWIVLFFYPKDNTPGCTKEACSFRDQYQVFRDLGAEVIGISSDSSSSHKEFADEYRLPFPLLSDSGGKVRKLLGVPSSFGLLPGRVTYVVDPKGVIRHQFNSLLKPEKHIAEALDIIKAG